MDKSKWLNDFAKALRRQRLSRPYIRRLTDELGQDIGYRKPGGLHLCLGDEEFEERERLLRRMHNQAGPRGYDYRMLDRKGIKYAV